MKKASPQVTTRYAVNALIKQIVRIDPKGKNYELTFSRPVNVSALVYRRLLKAAGRKGIE